MSNDSIIDKISQEFERVNTEHVRMMDFFSMVNNQHEDMLKAFKSVEAEHDKMTKDIAEIKSLLTQVLSAMKS